MKVESGVGEQSNLNTNNSTFSRSHWTSLKTALRLALNRSHRLVSPLGRTMRVARLLLVHRADQDEISIKQKRQPGPP